MLLWCLFGAVVRVLCCGLQFRVLHVVRDTKGVLSHWGDFGNSRLFAAKACAIPHANSPSNPQAYRHLRDRQLTQLIATAAVQPNLLCCHSI